MSEYEAPPTLPLQIWFPGPEEIIVKKIDIYNAEEIDIKNTIKNNR